MLVGLFTFRSGRDNFIMASVRPAYILLLLLLPIVINARIHSTAARRYNEDEVDNNNNLPDRSTVLYDINKDTKLQITSSSQSSTTHQKQLSNINNNPTSTFTAIFTINSGNTIQTNNGISVDINDIMFDISELFSEDYWYSFQPLKSLESKVDGEQNQRYKVHRILKQKRIIDDSMIDDSSSRRLQSKEESSVGSNVVEESDPIDKSQGTNSENEHREGEEKYIELLTNSLLSLVCVTMAALAAGLTMGMLSLDVSTYILCV